MAAQKTPGGMALPAGRFGKSTLGKLDEPKLTPDPHTVQVAWLRRRYGLAPQRASLVADLALAGGA